MLPEDEYYDKHDELNDKIIIHENSYEDPYDDDNYSHDYDDYDDEYENDVGSFYNDFISAERDGLNDSLVCKISLIHGFLSNWIGGIFSISTYLASLPSLIILKLRKVALRFVKQIVGVDVISLGTMPPYINFI
jgi:hypothetical protein